MRWLLKLLLFMVMLHWSPDSLASKHVLFKLERCEKTGQKSGMIHDCTPIAEKNLYIQYNYIPDKPIITGTEKKKMFRHEVSLGEHGISIGAWKPDPVKSLTVINVSLTEQGKGQTDYNEVSFFEDRNDNFISISLRPKTQTGEFYRIKLRQPDSIN